MDRQKINRINELYRKSKAEGLTDAEKKALKGRGYIMTRDGEHFIARVEVAVSEQFFGWITGLGRDVQIISPQSVVEKYRSLLADLGKLYEENNLGV